MSLVSLSFENEELNTSYNGEEKTAFARAKVKMQRP
jgi:hypothetical protein